MNGIFFMALLYKNSNGWTRMYTYIGHTFLNDVRKKIILHVNIRVETGSWAGVGRERVTGFEH